MGREGERTVPGGAEHARAFYEEWDFAKKAVCLYAAGLAWKGARIGVLLADADDIEWRGQVEEEALREALQDWIIDGHTTLAFSRETPMRLIARATPDSLEVSIETPEPFPSQGGVSLLWPACVNHETIKEQSRLIGLSPGAEGLLSFLLDDAHTSLGLPRWGLDRAQAASAPAGVVTFELGWYRVQVSNWRRHLGFSIEHGLRERLAANDPQVVQVLFDWNEDWFPEELIRGWEGVYEAFDRCDLTLVRFGEEFPAQLRTFVESGVFPRSMLAGWEKLDL